MRLIEAQTKLMNLKIPVLQTSDVSAYLKISRMHASKVLGRLGEVGIMLPVARGLWFFPDKVDPLMFPEYLTAPFPAYVSLQTALYFHGMISQIPKAVYAVSLARTKRYQTSLATISIHHIDPSFFFGFDVVKDGNIKIATPEKALLDTLYLAATRSLLFRVLPELQLPASFNIKSAFAMINKIPSLRLRTLVQKRFERVVDKT